MTSTATRPPHPQEVQHGPGPLGRLGTWVLDHRRVVSVVWVLLVVGLGVFAPRVEQDLSGAGWQADGSDSVAARDLAVEHFGGNASSAIQVVVRSSDGPVTEGEGARVVAAVTALLQQDDRIAEVVPPQPGATLSQDGDTPRTVAALLAETGWGPSRLTVLEHLGGEREAVISGTADSWGERRAADLNTVAVECVPAPGARPLSRLAGLPDDAFEHDGQLTKREVHAVTLARLAGADMPLDRALDGEDIWPVLSGTGHRSSHTFQYEWKGQRAIRKDHWKLHLPRLEEPRVYEAELYDLQADPWESRNLAREHPDVVAALTGEAETFDRETGQDALRVPWRNAWSGR